MSNNLFCSVNLLIIFTKGDIFIYSIIYRVMMNIMFCMYFNYGELNVYVIKGELHVVYVIM